MKTDETAAPSEFPYDVFLSHNSQDKPRVRRLAERLKAAGVRVWFDEWVIKAGDIIAQKVDEGLEQSRVLLLCISPTALASGWVTLERSTAIHRDPANSNRRFIPVLLNDCELPCTLRRYKYVDFREESDTAFAEVLVTCGTEYQTATVASVQNRTGTWAELLRRVLLKDFILEEGNPFEGHFYNRTDEAEALRWQSKGGERVGDMRLPKLPYYFTYWGYRAANLLALPETGSFSPITATAIRAHFGHGQWLNVMRSAVFENGPTARSSIAETVRHTARAAELLRLLHAESRIVSAVAWNLVHEASRLQSPDGSWLEFRGDKESGSLWSSVYVFCFLSGLLQADDEGVPAERIEFVRRAESLVRSTELYLIGQWKQQRWAFDSKILWQESAAAVVAEIAEHVKDKFLMASCYEALRSLVTPGGSLMQESLIMGPEAPPEDLQALRLAYALRVSGGCEALSDARYNSLVEWIEENLEIDTLRTSDIAFLARIIDLNAAIPKIRC